MPKVELPRAKLTLDDVKELRTALAVNTHVQLLDISHNALCVDCAREIGHIMTEEASLVTLVFQGNHLGGAGTTLFAQYMNRAQHLRIINLSGNMMGDTGARAIASALATNKTIEELDIGTNDIGDEGAVKLGRMLQENTALRVLDHIDRPRLGRRYLRRSGRSLGCHLCCG